MIKTGIGKVAGYVERKFGGVVGKDGTNPVKKAIDFVKNGKEITFKNSKTRIAPFGNRPKSKPTFSKKAPHYHRQRIDPNGNVKPGQGIGRHRPWESKSTDKFFWDRF